MGRAASRAAIAVVVFVFVLLALPRSALAGSESFALSWSSSGEPPCTAAEALEEAVVARLGRNPFVPVEHADVVLDGRELPSRGGRRRARVEQRDPQGRLLGARELEAATCVELTRSAAFVLVLIVDPDALLREPPPQVPMEAAAPPPTAGAAPPTAAAVAPLATPPSPAAPVAVARQRRRSAAREPALPIVHAGAGITVANGLLPGGDVGGAVMLGVLPWRLPVRFEWRGSYRIALDAERRREFTALVQEWRACFLVRPRSALGAVGCAGGAWAAIFPPTRGLSDGDQGAKAIYGPALALGPMYRSGPFALVADVSAFFPRPRWAFSYVNDTGQRRPLHELDRTVLSLTIGLTRTF